MTDPAPRVSVALCTRDGARYVAEQVGSVLAQTLPPAEIVLSDDDSSDDTVELVRKAVAEHLAAGGAPVELRVLENRPALGVTRNFEQALRACTGDLVALCDQDDVWRPDRLARMAAVFAHRPGLLLLHADARLVDGAGAPLGRTLAGSQGITPAELAELRGGQGFRTLLRRSLATGATVVLRRSLLDRAVPFPDEWVHDEWLAILAAAAGGHDYLPEQLGDYRQHGANVVGVGRGRRDKLALLLAPREARNRRLVARAEVLLARLEQLGAPAEARDRAAAKLAHERFRRALPALRPLRLLPVLRAYRTGTYAAYARGPQDALRDLLTSPH